MEFKGLFSTTFKPEHLNQIEGRDYEDFFTSQIRDLEENARELYENGPALSFLEDKIVAAGGVIRLQKGVGEAWLRLSRDFGGPSKRWVHLTRLIELELSKLDFHRIQTAIPLDFEPGHRFARHMGFRSEGIMRCYGSNGEDYERLARIECHKL